MAEDGRDENGSLIREGMRRAIAAGTAAIFMTEEGVRTLVGDLKLPKDIVRYVTEQAAAGRQDFFEMLRTEIRRFFDRYEPHVELSRLLQNLEIDVHAEVKFRRAADGSMRPEVKATATRGDSPRRKEKATRKAARKTAQKAGKAAKAGKADKRGRKKKAAKRTRKRG